VERLKFKETAQGMRAMKFLKSFPLLLVVFILSACSDNFNTKISDFIFSKEYYECTGTLSDRLIKPDGKINPANAIPSHITVLLDKFKGKLILDGDAPIQTIGVYFLICSSDAHVLKLNGTSCESEWDIVKRMESYGRKPIDIKNWIDYMHDNKVGGEFNRVNDELNLFSLTKNDAGTTEVSGAFKCKTKN